MLPRTPSALLAAMLATREAFHVRCQRTVNSGSRARARVRAVVGELRRAVVVGRKRRYSVSRGVTFQCWQVGAASAQAS